MIEQILAHLQQNYPVRIKAFNEIAGGFSQDKKYRLVTAGNEERLLKISGYKYYHQRESEFETLSRLKSLGVKCSEPLFFSGVESLDACYVLLSFLPGDDAEKKLSTYAPEVNYRIGFSAGQDLYRMHQLPLPAEFESWKSHKLRAHGYYSEKYRELSLHFKGDAAVVAYIDRNIHLLNDCKTTYLHDDFHPGNLIVENEAYSGCIDFNRTDWGDYAQDFVKMGWYGKTLSQDFARGQVQGYFGKGLIPEDFWKRYSLYMAMSIISNIAWHRLNFPDLLDNALRLTTEILEDHSGFSRELPDWYR